MEIIKMLSVWGALLFAVFLAIPITPTTAARQPEDVKVILNEYDSAITVNDEIVLLDAAPQILNLIMPVSIQVIEKILNAVIEWGYEMSVITITTNEQIAMPEPFVLTISVEEATLPQGENFRVSAEMVNNTGKCHEIVYDMLFWPVPGGMGHFAGIAVDWPEPRTGLIEADSIMRGRWFIGSVLEPGVHELRIRAIFYLQNEEREIRIYSNTILLTVE